MGQLKELLRGKIKSTDTLKSAYRKVLKAALGNEVSLDKRTMDQLVEKIQGDPKLRRDTLQIINEVLT